MRVLNDEDIKSLSWNRERNMDGYLDNCERIAKAQFQSDIKGFIKLLGEAEFFNDWGGDSAKAYRDGLVITLKELVEE